MEGHSVDDAVADEERLDHSLRQQEHGGRSDEEIAVRTGKIKIGNAWVDSIETERRSTIIMGMMLVGGIAFLVIVAGVYLVEDAKGKAAHTEGLSLQQMSDLADQESQGVDLFLYGVVVFLLALMVIVYIVLKKVGF